MRWLTIIRDTWSLLDKCKKVHTFSCVLDSLIYKVCRSILTPYYITLQPQTSICLTGISTDRPTESSVYLWSRKKIMTDCFWFLLLTNNNLKSAECISIQTLFTLITKIKSSSTRGLQNLIKQPRHVQWNYRCYVKASGVFRKTLIFWRNLMQKKCKYFWRVN